MSLASSQENIQTMLPAARTDGQVVLQIDKIQAPHTIDIDQVLGAQPPTVDQRKKRLPAR
jgi:hypothetical protein